MIPYFASECRADDPQSPVDESLNYLSCHFNDSIAILVNLDTWIFINLMQLIMDVKLVLRLN